MDRVSKKIEELLLLFGSNSKALICAEQIYLTRILMKSKEYLGFVKFWSRVIHILKKNIEYEESLFKVGDFIEWTFDNDESVPEHFRGNTFNGTIGAVKLKEKEYGVYCEYGQDFIGFNDCKKIKKDHGSNKT